MVQEKKAGGGWFTITQCNFLMRWLCRAYKYRIKTKTVNSINLL